MPASEALAQQYNTGEKVLCTIITATDMGGPRSIVSASAVAACTRLPRIYVRVVFVLQLVSQRIRHTANRFKENTE